MDAKIFAILEVQFEGRFWMGHRYVTIAEAEAELVRGNWYRCRRPRQPMRVYREKPQVAPSTSEETPAAMDSFDMGLVAGALGTKIERQMARAKLRNWKRVFEHDPMYAGAAIPAR